MTPTESNRAGDPDWNGWRGLKVCREQWREICPTDNAQRVLLEELLVMDLQVRNLLLLPACACSNQTHVLALFLNLFHYFYYKEKKTAIENLRK